MEMSHYRRAALKEAHCRRHESRNIGIALLTLLRHPPEMDRDEQTQKAILPLDCKSKRLMHFVQIVPNFDKMLRQINHDLQDADGSEENA